MLEVATLMYLKMNYYHSTSELLGVDSNLVEESLRDLAIKGSSTYIKYRG